MAAQFSLVFLIFALILFLLGIFSYRWTVSPERPWYGSFISAGLFFWVFSELLVRMAGHQP